MKKSRIAKFALLGASAAALAATLSTSTYAWYVSNKTATVTASTGSTATAAADGSISVSNTGAYGKFFKTISLGNFTGEGKGLVPVKATYATNAFTFTDIAGEEVDVATVGNVLGGSNHAVTTDEGVFHYEFYIKADETVTVTPTVTIKNTTTTYKDQVCLTTVAATLTAMGGLTSGQTFYVNALNALTLTHRQTPSSVAYASDYTWTAGTIGAVNTQLLGTGLTGRVVTQTENDLPGTAVTGGAQAYYTDISGAIPAGYTTPYDSGEAGLFSTFTLTKDVPVKMEYWLFLDGADQACFNACQGQSFSIEFSYQAS